MTRCWIFGVTLFFGIATFSPEPGAASDPGMKLELRVLDQDSFSPLFHAIVTIRLAGSKTDEKKGGTGKPTEGEGILKFNSMGAGELEINGCRQDHVPSGWKRWGELESDEKGRKVLMLKVSTSKDVYKRQS